jgi:hypothetical protein
MNSFQTICSFHISVNHLLNDEAAEAAAAN